MNSTMSIGQARKMVEQLKIEASLCRIKVGATLAPTSSPGLSCRFSNPGGKDASFLDTLRSEAETGHCQQSCSQGRWGSGNGLSQRALETKVAYLEKRAAVPFGYSG